MKQVVLSAVLVAALTVQADAEIVYWGTLTWTGVTSCPNDQLSDVIRTTFHPAALGTNQNFTGAGIIFNYGALGYYHNGPVLTGTKTLVDVNGVGWSGYVPPSPIYLMST